MGWSSGTSAGTMSQGHSHSQRVLGEPVVVRRRGVDERLDLVEDRLTRPLLVDPLGMYCTERIASHEDG